MLRKNIFVLLVFSFLSLSFVFADSGSGNSTDPEPYAEDEFTQFMKDMRRSEIIFFGSLPFMTMGVSMGYSGWQLATGRSSSFAGPFSPSSYSSDDIKKILGISLGVSGVFCVTDYFITRHNRKKTAAALKVRKINYGEITITSVPNDAYADEVLPQEDVSESVEVTENLTEETE